MKLFSTRYFAYTSLFLINFIILLNISSCINMDNIENKGIIKEHLYTQIY